MTRNPNDERTWLVEVLSRLQVKDRPVPLTEQDGHTLYTFSVPGVDTVQTWERLRMQAGATGFWPVMLGDDDDLDLLLDRLDDPSETAQSIVAEGMRLDAETWLDEMIQESVVDPESYDCFHGEWPEDVGPSVKFALSLGGSDAPAERIHFAMVPAAESWQTPAYMKFGGLGENPRPAEHVALLKRWHTLYGVEVAALCVDRMECRVARPPRERATALRLAEEQFAYCVDLVVEATHTVEALAATLLNGTVWTFWWD